MTTFSYPGDAVANGRTVIQGSTFVPASGDYDEVKDYWNIRTRAAEFNTLAQTELPEYFPTNEVAARNWQFFHRTNVGSGATSGNIVGVHRRTTNHTVGYRDVSESKDVRFNFRRYSVRVINWIYEKHVTASGDIIFIPHRKADVSVSFIFDAESNAIAEGGANEDAIAVAEALGFIWTPVATSWPNWNPLKRIIIGGSPFA